MKTIKTVLTIIAIGMAAIAGASERNTPTVKALGADKVLVSVQPGQAASFELTITDDNNQIVYFKESKQPVESYQKVFNLKNLENGEYALILSINGERSESTLIKSQEKIQVSSADKIAPPFFAFDGEKLVMSHLNFEKKAYQLEIYGKEGLVYSGSVNEKEPFSALFNFSKMELGNYEVVMSSLNDHFNYRFKK